MTIWSLPVVDKWEQSKQRLKPFEKSEKGRIINNNKNSVLNLPKTKRENACVSNSHA